MYLPKSIKDSVEEKSGLDISALSPLMLQNIALRRTEALKLNSIQSYYSLLGSSPKELHHFIDALLVPETWFFRDKALFEFLEKYLIHFKKISDQIRILSIPCASGEEVYSIAITLKETHWSSKQYTIIGADISEALLEKAQIGQYKRSAFRNPSYHNTSYLINTYFNKEDNGLYKVKDFLKESVIFKKENLVNPLFLKNCELFDIIFLRNVLIYFTGSARRKTLLLVDQLLKNTGVLFVGHADNILATTDSFKPLGTPSAFAFTKKNTPQTVFTCPRPLIAKPLLYTQTKPTFRPPPKKKLTISPKLKERAIQQNPLHYYNPQQQTSPFETAQNLANVGKIEKAIKICKSLIEEQNMQNCELFFLTGQIYLALNNETLAKEMFKKVLYLDRKHIQALFQLELIYSKENDKENLLRIRQRIQCIEEETT